MAPTNSTSQDQTVETRYIYGDIIPWFVNHDSGCNKLLIALETN